MLRATAFIVQGHSMFSLGPFPKNQSVSPPTNSGQGHIGASCTEKSNGMPLFPTKLKHSTHLVLLYIHDGAKELPFLPALQCHSSVQCFRISETAIADTAHPTEVKTD